MKKWAIFLVLIMLSLLGMNIAKANELTDDYFDIATNYFNAHNKPKALEYLDLILTIEPENLPAKTLRNKISPSASINNGANATTEQNASAGTIDENNIILSTPQVSTQKVTCDSNYYNNKGLDYYQAKDYKNANMSFYKAIALNRHNAQAHNNLAMSYWAQNNTCEAIKYFLKANAVNKCYSEPLVNLSKLYKQLGNDEKQVYYLKKAIKSNTKDYMAHYELGNYYKELSQFSSAIDCYKNVVKIKPDFSEVYINLAMCFFETEQFNYALIALKQYQEFYPNSDFAFYLAAKSDLAINQYEEAKDNIEKAIKINSTDDYKYELGKIDYSLMDYISAIDVFKNLIKSSGVNAEYFNYWGLSSYKIKDLDTAVLKFQRAIELDGLKPIYYYNLAQCYKSLGDKTNYNKYLDMATKISPNNLQDFIDLSYIYYDNGNTDKALNSLNDGIKKYPYTKSIYLAKLKIYEAKGDNLHYNETKDLIDMRFNRR